MFFAVTDTTSVALEWAMAELINNPEIFKKLRDEISAVVGPNRLVKESDVPNLPYLRAIIKETLRLHPPAPHPWSWENVQKIAGSTVVLSRPRQELLLMSTLSWRIRIHGLIRMNSCLKDSWSSEEKIGEHQMEFKAQNFRYLPFGNGRRGCPGASFAMLVTHATLGALVQCCGWKIKDGEKIDLRPGPGFSAEMARSLVCNPIKHMKWF